MPNWATISRCGTWAIRSASSVPRRMIALASTEPVAQSNPPNRNLAQAARKYVQITAIWVTRSAQPPACVRVGSPCRARPAVGSTASATRSPNRSWSTLP